MNGQAQQQGISIHQDPLQHQYAVVKKTGSKRDIRENLERENSAIFKVKYMKENSINYVVVVNPNEPENSVHKVWDRVSVQPRRIDSSYSIHKLHNSIGINQS